MGTPGTDRRTRLGRCSGLSVRGCILLQKHEGAGGHDQDPREHVRRQPHAGRQLRPPVPINRCGNARGQTQCDEQPDRACSRPVTRGARNRARLFCSSRTFCSHLIVRVRHCCHSFGGLTPPWRAGPRTEVSEPHIPVRDGQVDVRQARPSGAKARGRGVRWMIGIDGRAALSRLPLGVPGRSGWKERVVAGLPGNRIVVPVPQATELLRVSRRRQGRWKRAGMWVGRPILAQASVECVAPLRG